VSVLAFVSLLFLVAGPRIFLYTWLNRDLGEESFFQSVSAGQIELGLFLDTLSVKDLKFSGTNPQQTLTIAEIRLAQISPLALTKASLGLGDWIDFLVDVPIELRQIQAAGLGSLVTTGSLATLSLNLLATPEAAKAGFSPLGLSVLKLTDLSLTLQSDQSSWSLETLALEGLTGSQIQSLIFTGLAVLKPQNDFKIGELALNNFDFFQFQERLTSETLPFPDLLSLLNVLETIQACQIKDLVARPGLSLAKADWVKPLDPDVVGGRDLRIQALALDFDALARRNMDWRPYSSSPLGQAFWDALGPQTVTHARFNLPASQERHLTAHLNIEVQDKGQLSLTWNSPESFIKSLLKARPNLLSLLSGLGPGSLSFEDKSFTNAFAAAYQARTGQNLASLWSDSPTALVDPAFFLKEIQDFLANPQSLMINWRPPSGFPLASFQKIIKSDLKQAANLFKLNAEDLANNYGYVLINDLNLTLKVNDRPPLTLQAPIPSE
jgi:hypothetical protein